MDVGHYGWTKRLDYYQTHPEFVIAPVPVAPNYGVFNVGAGPFDGVSSGFFNGHSQGTQFAINTAASFNGNIIDCQKFGVDTFTVDASGNITASGRLNLAAQPDIQALVWMEAM